MSTGGSWGKESHDVGLDPTSDRTPTVLESGAYNPIVFTVCYFYIYSYVDVSFVYVGTVSVLCHKECK
jgi:hypothetical protein